MTSGMQIAGLFPGAVCCILILFFHILCGWAHAKTTSYYGRYYFTLHKEGKRGMPASELISLQKRQKFTVGLEKVDILLRKLL